jgi:hypothetical protein
MTPVTAILSQDEQNVVARPIDISSRALALFHVQNFSIPSTP